MFLYGLNKMESVQKARNRMSQLPRLLSSCATEASAYAKCAVRIDDLKKDDCLQEFKVFLECTRKKAASSNIRLI